MCKSCVNRPQLNHSDDRRPRAPSLSSNESLTYTSDPVCPYGRRLLVRQCTVMQSWLLQSWLVVYVEMQGRLLGDRGIDGFPVVTSPTDDLILCCRGQWQWWTGVQSGSYLVVDTVVTSLAVLMNRLAFLSQEHCCPEPVRPPRFLSSLCGSCIYILISSKNAPFSIQIRC